VKVTSSSSSATVGGPVQPRLSAIEKRDIAPASILVRTSNGTAGGERRKCSRSRQLVDNVETS
jgi:hypothetical protein